MPSVEQTLYKLRWWEYQALQRQRGLPAASYRTLCRVYAELNKSGQLRFRRAGQHATCSICEGYKKQLRDSRLGPTARQQVLDSYTKHLVDQWLDRQVYDHLQEMSLSTMQGLSVGLRGLPDVTRHVSCTKLTLLYSMCAYTSAYASASHSVLREILVANWYGCKLPQP